MPRALRRVTAVAISALLIAAASPADAQTVPVPRPTSTEISPGAPNPHPPLGGLGPDGKPAGGSLLMSRGIVRPAGSPALPKDLPAQAWVLSDLDTGEILAARDAHGRYQPASILKALTSLVLLPKLPGARVVTVSATAANAEGSAVGLVAGGKYTVDTLFKALLLMSGNDAAMALAQAGGGASTTVAAMNAEALRLGAYDTFVQTPSGLDGWQQLTSAYDLSLILRAIVDNPRFVAYDRTLKAALPAQKVGTMAWGAVPLENQSENFLTTVPGALIAKTGYTDAALHTYMCAVERHGRRLGLVLLRNQRVPKDQFEQAAALFNWGFALPASSRPVGDLEGPVTVTPPSPSRSSDAATASTRVAAPSATVQAVAPASPAARGFLTVWTVIDAVALLLIARGGAAPNPGVPATPSAGALSNPSLGSADLGALAKAHLHVHLESTVRPGTLAELADANGVRLPPRPPVFAGFRAFADVNSAVRSCLRRPADFRRIALDFCADAAADGVDYAEVTFTAASHGERLGDLEMPLASVVDGLAEGDGRYGTETRVLLDHSRRRSLERAWATLRLAQRHPERVIGLGVAGEESYPLAPFADVFAAAADAGLHLVHHAGEEGDAIVVREALDLGRAERIGHGIGALADPDLVAELAERRIPLEVCPSSNVALGFAATLAAHPLERMRTAGLNVTLNTDIPDVTGTTLSQEYAAVADTFGYDAATLADLARAGVDASFAGASTKARLHQQITDWATA